VLEQAGLATIQLASIRSYVERMRPPRALYCEFPLGRPLGYPGDVAFQRRVLEAAFALLPRRDVPVLEDFPERIGDSSEEPLACRVPARFDPDLSPAVDEATALRAAYDRQLASSGRTNVGHDVDASRIPQVVAAFERVADGTPYEEAALPGDPRSSALDVRAYYEEAALELAGHSGARQTDAWFYRDTEAGSVMRRAQSAMREAEAPFEVWFYIVPLAHWDDPGLLER
jgi:hypothetical protein